MNTYRCLCLPGLTTCSVVSSQIMHVRLGTSQAISVKKDGGVCVTRQGSFTGSDRYGIVPVLSLEVSFSIHLTKLGLVEC